MNGSDIVKDFKEIRSKVGYMPGKFSLYQDLTVEENLEFFASIFKTSIEENYDLVKDIYVQIEPFKNIKLLLLSRDDFKPFFLLFFKRNRYSTPA